MSEEPSELSCKNGNHVVRKVYGRPTPCINCGARVELDPPTPTQSDWERRNEIKEVVDMVVLKCNENIGQLTHICSAIEHLAEKQYKAGLATSQQETLERVVEKVEGQRARWVETKNSPVDPEQIKGFYNAAIDNALTAIKSTLQETR